MQLSGNIFFLLFSSSFLVPALRESFHNKSLENFIEILLTNSPVALHRTYIHILKRAFKVSASAHHKKRPSKNFKLVTTFSCAFKHFNFHPA